MMKRTVETEETKSTAFEGVLQETESERGREQHTFTGMILEMEGANTSDQMINPGDHAPHRFDIKHALFPTDTENQWRKSD